MLLLTTYNLDAFMMRRGVDEPNAEFAWRDDWFINHRRCTLESVVTSTTAITFPSNLRTIRNICGALPHMRCRGKSGDVLYLPGETHYSQPDQYLLRG